MKKVLIVFSIIFITSLAAVIIGLSKVSFREEFKSDWKSFELNFEKAGDQTQEKMEYLAYQNAYDRFLDANEETTMNFNEYETLKVVSMYDDVYIKQDDDIEEIRVKYEVSKSKNGEYKLRIDDMWDYRKLVISGNANKEAEGKIYISMPKDNTFKLQVTVGKGNVYFDKIEVE